VVQHLHFCFLPRPLVSLTAAMECLAGCGSTAALTLLVGACNQRRLKKLALAEVTDDDILKALKARGVDIEQHVMEAYIKKNYTMIGKLGQGVYGQVWKVQKKKTREFFAMKEIQIFAEADLAIQTEVRCLRRLQHRHIVNIAEVFETKTHMWIVMECAEGGNIYERIVKLNHFSEQGASKIIKQVLKAVHYMHSYGIAHRDLKLENLLLMTDDPDSDVKVADFGLAAELNFEGYKPDESMRMKKATPFHEGYVGSPICMAPEVASRHAKYGPQCDIWSVGCMTFELLEGSPPFKASSVAELFRLIHTTSGPSFQDRAWECISDDAQDIVVKMLQKKPEDRLSAREALHHDWFRTAPNTHMAQAHSRMVSRMTSCGTHDTASRTTTRECLASRMTSKASAQVHASRQGGDDSDPEHHK